MNRSANRNSQALWALVFSFACSIPAYGEVIVTSGIDCNAVTPLHSGRAEWREYGITNKDKKKDLWVSCPLNRLETSFYSDREFSAAVSIFNVDTGPILNAPVACYLKEMSGAQRVSVEKAQTSVEVGAQELIGICGVTPESWLSSFIFVCKLPPETGISALMTESHLPGDENSILQQELSTFGFNCSSVD
jgi:hypothetical protein